MTKFEDFVDLVHSVKNKELLRDFLIGITSPHERRILSRRVEIIKRLLAGDTQLEIAGDLKVGISTVTRGSRELAQGRLKILRKK